MATGLLKVLVCVPALRGLPGAGVAEPGPDPRADQRDRDPGGAGTSDRLHVPHRLFLFPSFCPFGAGPQVVAFPCKRDPNQVPLMSETPIYLVSASGGLMPGKVLWSHPIGRGTFPCWKAATRIRRTPRRAGSWRPSRGCLADEHYAPSPG